MTSPPTAAPTSSVSLVTPRMLASLPSLGVIAGLAVAAVAAAFGWTGVALAGLVVSAVAEPPLHASQPLLVKALRAASIGLGTRVVLRLLVAAVALAHGSPSTSRILGWAACALLFVAVRSGYVLVTGQLRARRTPVFETRNIPWTGLDFPRPLPSALTAWSGSAVSALEVFVTAPACLPGLPTSVVVGSAALGVVAQVAVVTVLAWDSRRLGGTLQLAGMQPVLQSWLDRHRPEVVLYFGDNRAAVYQVKMWLAVMEALPQRCMVVLRNRLALTELGPTRLPVLCAPSPVSLMALDLAPVRAALYVSNIGNNIHLLREPGILSSFIGHGDSDKNGSFSPYTRVYDEVWVAGPAGRERYRQADVGVVDSDVVEVGRPQLDTVTSGPVRRSGHVPTVLYAPTWEGWNDEQAYGSVATHGVSLAETLLRPDSGVRLVYRPHPFTGQRDPVVAAAHRRILQLIADANERAGQPRQPAVEWPDTGNLETIADAAVRSKVSGETADPVSAARAEQLRAEAEAAFWAAARPLPTTWSTATARR